MRGRERGDGEEEGQSEREREILLVLFLRRTLTNVTTNWLCHLCASASSAEKWEK